MNGTPPENGVQVDAADAKRRAEQCALDSGVEIGAFLQSQHHSARRLSDALRAEQTHGHWQISFANPHYDEEVNTLDNSGVIETPGASKFFIFLVNDRTGDTELFLCL